jgi:hypothetical protein
MRSIRVGGRTDLWVVHAFLLREQKGEERGRALRRETTFAGEACIPRLTTGTDYEAADNIKYQSI